MDETAQKDAFKAAILEELKKQERLKKEVLVELGAEDKKGKASKFFQHPAMLLVLGFLLTGVVGGSISSCWQERTKERQQAVLVQQRSLDQKYELTNEIAKALGEAHASTSAMLFSVTQTSDDKELCSQLTDQVKAWREANQRWLVTSNTLLQKLVVHFPAPAGTPIPSPIAPPSTQPDAGSDPLVTDPTPRDLFETIVNRRRIINNRIVSIVEALKQDGCDRHRPLDTNEPDGIKVIGAASDEVKALNALRDRETKMLMGLLAGKILGETTLR